MKKIIATLLTLVIATCLINLNNCVINAEENDNLQLYFENGDNGYSFYTKDDVSTTEYTTGKGTTWNVRGDANHPVLELHGFSYTSGNDQSRVLSLYPHTPNVELTIEVYGENSFISTASGDNMGYVLQFAKNTHVNFSKVEIVGMTSDAKLNLIHNGATTKRQNQAISVLGITADMGALDNLTFKDVECVIDLNDPASLDYLTGNFGNGVGINVSVMDKLIIDNSTISITAGKTEVNLPVVIGTTVVKPCFSITNDAAKDDSISLIGNSKLILSGTLCATYATNLSKLFSSPQISYKAYTSMDGKPGSETSNIKYETFTLITGFDVTTYTNGLDGTDKLPIKRLEITSGESKPVDPSPSQPKDESCEKVIGPTWHWNNTKGICEDYGVVGTYTR